jgi:membrane protease YdiL (CAAX protease family)
MTDLYRTEGSALVVVPMFLLTLTLAGVFYGWLRLWSGSLGPVSVAHGAINTTWYFSDTITQTRTPMGLEYFGGESGVFMIAGLVILDVLLIRSIRRSAKLPGAFFVAP